LNPPSDSAYSLDEKEDIDIIGSPSSPGTLKLEALDDDLLSTAQPATDTPVGAGDEPKQPGQERRPRKKK
uniref:ClpXP protease specificity-enhancing factor n=1 Tax=Echinostoma caproni TaxID=27848 RepID=A0A183BBC4_9TREM